MPPVDAVLLIFAILLGLAFGSFLNVCIVRLPQGKSIVSPPSHCVACGGSVRTRDNIPVLSWLLLRCKCRDCGVEISPRYPLVEAGTDLLFAACLLHFGATLVAVGMAVFCWLLLGLLLMDAETFLLPDAFSLPGIALGLIYQAAVAEKFVAGLLRALIGALAVGGFLLLVRLLYRLIRRREGMGFGDVKLGVMMGAWLGWQLGAVALFLGIVLGAWAAIATVLLIRKREQTESTAMQRDGGGLRIPFGAFLAGAGIVAVFAGDPLLHWYLRFFP